jgi:hypothetical protein
MFHFQEVQGWNQKMGNNVKTSPFDIDPREKIKERKISID